MSDAFDENALMDRVDDDVEFLEETVTMLDEDSPALLEQIRVAAASGDAPALVKPAHALKGMLANFCAEPAESAARDAELRRRFAEQDAEREAEEALIYPDRHARRQAARAAVAGPATDEAIFERLARRFERRLNGQGEEAADDGAETPPTASLEPDQEDISRLPLHHPRGAAHHHLLLRGYVLLVLPQLPGA